MAIKFNLFHQCSQHKINLASCINQAEFILNKLQECVMTYSKIHFYIFFIFSQTVCEKIQKKIH